MTKLDELEEEAALRELIAELDELDLISVTIVGDDEMSAVDDAFAPIEAAQSAYKKGLMASEAPVEEVKTEWPEPRESLGTNPKMFSDLFGFKPFMGDFPVSTFEGFDTPERMDYIWPKKETAMFVHAVQHGLKPRLVGDAGTGKTEMVAQVAAVTGRPFWRFSFNHELEAQDLVGYTGLVGGETQFQEGDLIRAMREPSLILFDEFTRANAAMVMTLQRFTEKLELHVPNRDGGDAVLSSHEHAALVVADNTKGLGDSLDKYAAANVQDVSSLNRWGLVIPMTYLSKADQVRFIQKCEPGFPNAEAESLARVSVKLQQAFVEGQIPLPFTMRNLRVTAQYAVLFQSVQEALDWQFLKSLDEESVGVAQTIVKGVLG